MPRAELIGLIDCPECGFSDAEVRNDKGGSPYRYCPDCTAQYFTRGGVKAKNLLAKLRRPPDAVTASPVTASALENRTLAVTDEKKPEEKAPVMPQKKRSLAFDLGAI